MKRCCDCELTMAEVQLFPVRTLLPRVVLTMPGEETETYLCGACLDRRARPLAERPFRTKGKAGDAS